jgi:hypothetical protein
VAKAKAAQLEKKSNRGGRRPGAGRRPKPLTDLNRKLCERLDDAVYAFELHAGTMRDEKQPLDLRLDCAKEVMNRVLGKPAAVAIQPQGPAQLTADDIRASSEQIRANRLARGAG